MDRAVRWFATAGVAGTGEWAHRDHDASRLRRARLLAAVGLLAMLVMATPHVLPADDSDWALPAAPGGFESKHSRGGSAGQPARATDRATATAAPREFAAGGYGGVAYTHPSTVRIFDPPRTDLSVSGFDWIGRPFKSPIYYGLRAQLWPVGGALGGMLDFTHAKAIAEPTSRARLQGTHNGRSRTGEALIGDTFRHLEFSHGHNMLTANVVGRLAPFWRAVRPYAGFGAGVSLPHTEVGFRGENARTYEYQYAGMVAQGLIGLEIGTGRGSVFVEYKFSYAPYDVPLSHEPYGWLLVTDLWRQTRAWIVGETPPGGRLSTTLATHHVIAGALLRSGARAPIAP